MIEPCKLHSLLRVSFDTGELTWKPRHPDMFQRKHNTAEQQCKIWNTRYSGKRAFMTVDSNGYFCAAIFNKKYRAHRVIWAMKYGYWPTLIDHINQIRADNRLSNLRESDKSRNAMNSKTRADNTSGYRGVTKHQGRWMAQTSHNGKHHYIGMFDTPDEASRAYKEFRANLRQFR